MWVSYGSLLCSLAAEGEFSAARCSGGAPCAPWRSIPTASSSCSPGSAMASSQPSPSGMMCKPLTGGHGEDWSMSSAEDSRAKTLASPGAVQGLMGSEAASGAILRASFARFDRASCSWKTPQLSLLGDLGKSSVIWPRAGMMQDGECSEQTMLAHRISASASGSEPSWRSNPSRNAWPTPTAADGTSGPDRRQRGASANLRSAVRWPTPTVHGNHNRKGASKTSGDGLSTAVKTWPTPTANDSKNATCPPSQAARDSIPGELIRQNNAGPLNPAWVEWLMGWPAGWTDLGCLETDKFRSWWRAHGLCSDPER